MEDVPQVIAVVADREIPSPGIRQDTLTSRWYIGCQAATFIKEEVMRFPGSCQIVAPFISVSAPSLAVDMAEETRHHCMSHSVVHSNHGRTWPP